MKPNPQATISLIMLAAAVLSARAGMRLVELPTLPGAGSDAAVVATDVNNRGQITGYAVAYTLHPYPPETHAFVYDPGVGQMTDLGTFVRPDGEGTMASFGKAINDEGLVVGDATVEMQSPQHAVPAHAFRCPATGGPLVDLGTLGGSRSTACGLNNSNVIVGESATTNWARAFWWSESEGMVALPHLPNWKASAANAINDFGVIAGGGVRTNEETCRAAIWRNGQPLELGSLGGDVGAALAINNAGMVVGYSWLLPGSAGGCHGFAWTEATGMVDLVPPPDCDYSFAYGLNDRGVIVGVIAGPERPGNRAACWVNGHWFDLQNRYLIGWSNTLAHGINNAGWIAGCGQNPEGNVRAWLLIPEPPAAGGPVITQALMTAEGFVMRGTNGRPLAEYEVLFSTDVASPLSAWSSLATNLFDPEGTFACTNALPDSPAQGYFRLRTVGP